MGNLKGNLISCAMRMCSMHSSDVNRRKYQSICKFIFHHVAHNLLHRGAFLEGKVGEFGSRICDFDKYLSGYNVRTKTVISVTFFALVHTAHN